MYQQIVWIGRNLFIRGLTLPVEAIVGLGRIPPCLILADNSDPWKA